MKTLYSRLLVLAFTLLTNVVFAQVNAAFTNSTASGCSPLVVSFTDQSTNATQWRWDFGNGNTSVQKNPSAAYLAPGTYTVRLIAINGGTRDTLIKTNLITVFRSPAANFRVSDTIGCFPKTISFTDLSIPGDAAITSWLWDFGDGITSTQQNPTHTYTSAGVNSIVLLTRDANGCTNRLSIDNLISITAQPVANYTATPRTSCAAPLTVTFTNTSTGTGLSYLWAFGDGTTSTDVNPVHTYNAPGSYSIRLTVTKPGGCSHSYIRNNYVVVSNYAAAFTVNNTGGCIGAPFNFTDQSTSGSNSWRWDFGDGTTSATRNPSHTYTTSGTYNVTLIAGNAAGCRDTLVETAYITVTPAPVVSFVADSSNNCELPFTVNFINSSLYGSTYFWDFGDSTYSTDGNPSHTYIAEGSYNVVLTVSSAGGCSTTAAIDDSIRIALTTADYGADQRRGCIPVTVNFEDRSTSPDSIVLWEWDLGDGTTSTLRNPSHVYAVRGSYDVTLIVTSTKGCKDTLVTNNFIRAGEPPVVDFEADRLFSCLYLPINFADLSTSGDEWLWDFGDGGTSQLQDPAYVYGDTGIFTVTLIVGDNGCYDTLIKDDYIQIYPPAARFDPIQSCTTPYTVNFVNNSLGGHIWVWSFGDGDSSWDRHPTHTYASRGYYAVRLYVEDTIGHCFHDQTTTIAITDPVAAFTGDKTGCEPFATTYFKAGVDAISYLWTFEDGHSIYRDVQDTTAINDTLLTAGKYPLTITVRDINGCYDTRPDTITVLKSTAYFGADTFTGCVPLTVQYADSSTSYLGSVNSWSWNLGNGVTSTLQNPSSTYTVPGNYNISLTVTDDNGCQSTINRVNFIYPTYPEPGFNASVTDICLGQPAVFNNTSVGTGMTYAWDFGDGNTSTDVNPQHTYADTGEYTITLVAHDINGCDSTRIRTNYIRVVQAHADFSVDTTFANCPPLQVTFTDLSHDSITGWAYYFGDNQVSSARNPTHIYNRPGVFHPYLVATNYAGCTDTSYLADSIVVLGPYGTFDFVQTTTCVPFDITFIANNTNSVSTNIWDLADGSVEVAGDTITHTYTLAGVYNPVLILRDSLGCTISIPTPRPIVATDINADFSANISFLCRGGNVTFTDLSTSNPGVGSWLWRFGDGTTSTSRNPIHNYTAPGIYDVTLVATNTSGCSDTMVYNDMVTIAPAPNAAFTASTTATCFPNGASFTDNSTSDSTIISRNWSFGDGATATGLTASHTYAAPGTYNVRLIINTTSGCPDTAVVPVTIYALPVANAGADRAICRGTSTQLTASGGTSYVWSPATGLSAANIRNPIASPTVTTTYVVLATNANGCQDTDTITVTVNALPIAEMSADTTICYGQSAEISADGGISYAWSGAGLSSNSSSNPVASPLASTTYSATITDINGCTATGTTRVNINPLPIPVLSNDTSICPGGSAQLNVAGGTSYVWSPATGLNYVNIANPVSTPASAITYTATVTDINGCVNRDSVTISIHALPVIGISPDAAICIGSSTQVTATGGVSYAWTPATNIDNASIANPTVSPTATATYTVLITDNHTCLQDTSVVITVNPLPIPVLSADTAICIGESAQLSAAGGVSYVWTGAALDNNNISNPVATPLTTTTYAVTVTDANGCSNTDSLTITINPLPVVIVSNDTAICIGQTANLRATGGVSYVWSPATGLSNANIANPAANPTVTTTYTVQVTNANGCVNTAQVTVTINPLPVPTITPNTAICYNSSVQLQATGGITYLWTPGTYITNVHAANPFVYPIATTTFNVRVTDANGCRKDTSVVITVNPLPIPVLSNDTAICIGETAQLFAAGGVSYHWSGASLNANNIANPTSTPLATSTYHVTVTDANGCSNTDSLVVTVNPLPVVIVSNDTAICTGETANLRATGGVSYEWTPATGLNSANIANPTASPTVTTTYTVQVTNANGCVNTNNVTVTINALPVLTINPDTAFCEGRNAQLLATGGVAYHWTPGTYITNANIANPFVYPVTTTTYNVLVTDANGCQNDTSVTITIHPLPIPVVTNDTAICNGSSVTLNASGAATYQWSPANGLSCTTCASPVASPDTTTMYVVRLTSAYGCSVNDTVNVTVNDIHNALTLSDTVGCTPTTVSFTAITSGDGSISNAWSFGDNTISTQNNPQHTYTAAGNYTIQLVSTSSFGCTDTATANVVINGLPQINAGADATICLNDSTMLTAGGGVTYQWSPAVGLNDASVANPTASPAATTSYIVTVTDTNGCVNYDTTLVNVNPLPTPAITGTAAICAGDSAQLTATGGNTYTWTPVTGLNAANIANPIASPDSTTIYTVTATDSNGCSNTADFTVTVNPLPIAKLSSDTTLCIGQVAVLEALGADSYLWTPATGLSCDTCTLVTASPDSTTTYIVEFTSAFGCVVYDTVTVTINPLPVINATADTAICAGQSLQLQASAGGTYLWIPATGLDCDTCASPVAAPTVNTTYIVAVTSPTGCYAEDTINVGVHQLHAEFIQSDSAVCSPAPVKFNDVSMSDSTITAWSWSFGDGSTGTAQNPTHNYTTVGAFDAQLIITNSAGCSDTVVHPVILTQPPVANAGNDTAICLGSSVTLQGSGLGAYTWNNSSSLDDSTSINPVATPASTTSYVLTIVAANGCIDTDTVTVTVNALPIANASGNNSGCEGENLQLQATGGVSYTWSPAVALNNANVSNPVMTADSSRTYTVIVTDVNGCQATDSIAITVTPMPAPVIKALTDICAGDTLTLTAGGGSTYQWSPATGLSCTTCEAPVAQPLEDITYTVTVSNGNCSATTSHALTVHALPVVNALEGSTVCRGTDVTLSTTATGAVSYLWNPAATLSDSTAQSPVASPQITTMYNVTAFNSLGCSAKDSVQIRVVSDVTFTLSNDTSICPGNAVDLNAQVVTLTGLPARVEWLPANLFGNNTNAAQTVRPYTTTQYLVVAHSSTCAPDTQVITVTVHAQPDVNAGYNQTVIQNQQVSLTANSTASIVSYSWLPADSLDCATCQEVNFTAGQTKAYTVLVTDENGCVASDTVLVRIITSCEDEVFVPNLFTPNNDGNNDVLYVRGQGLHAIKTFRVFDRWGNLVFETDDITQGWNGTYKGSMLNDGVFVYYVEGTCSDGAAIAKKGNVTLLR